MATPTDPEKKLDLPPRGPRNADPITDEPGSHPIETGIGAAVAGAVAGMAAAAVAGPVTTAIGVALGAVAGGYAGKEVGEWIDPTTDDSWLRDNFESRPYVRKGDRYEDYCPAFRYGGLAESKYGDAGLDLTDERLRAEWEASDESEMPWEQARDAVKDGYDRSMQIRKNRECAASEPCDWMHED
jgi:hypothetical protein